MENVSTFFSIFDIRARIIVESVIRYFLMIVRWWKKMIRIRISKKGKRKTLKRRVNVSCVLEFIKKKENSRSIPIVIEAP